MKTVGMLRSIKQPGILARTIAYMCHFNDIVFFYFTPEDVDTEHQQINGLFLENGQWRRGIIGYPDVVDNEPMKAVNKSIYDSLQTVSVMTTHTLGGKNKVFKMLSQSNNFKDVLIPYRLVKKPEDILDFLTRYQKILLKPVFSNQGRNIYVIERCGDKITLSDDMTSTTLSEEDLLSLINNKFLKPNYICQPFFESKTKEGHPFDIRLHVRKNEKGQWQKVKIYPRIGRGRHITSNISQGGGISPIVPFLKANFGDNWKDIKRRLEQLCVSFPKRFERFYDYELDALGIDLGVNPQGEIGLFEVNTYPGQQFFYAEDSEVRVSYYQYLLNRIHSDRVQ